MNDEARETASTKRATTSRNTHLISKATTPLGVIEPFLRSALFLGEEDTEDNNEEEEETETAACTPSVWSGPSSSSSVCDNHSSADDEVLQDKTKTCSIWPSSSASQLLGGGGGELYGRQDAAHELLQAFERCCCSCAAAPTTYTTTDIPPQVSLAMGENSAAIAAAAAADDDESVLFELVLITGASGTGKTSLVKTILKPLVLEREGFFISTKFEQPFCSTRTAPYYPMQQAFQEFVQQARLRDHNGKRRHNGDVEENTTSPSTTAAASPLALLQEMQRIVDPIVASEPLLLNMLPSLKDLISASVFLAAAAALTEQDNSSVRSGPSTEHRLLQAFVRLVRAVCSPTRPLVLFLGKHIYMIDDSEYAFDSCCISKASAHLLYVS
jgi:AAA ATPase domain